MLEGGSGNFMAIQLDDTYYLQVAAENGSTLLSCEAVSNKFLSGSYQLTDIQENRLLRLGWQTPNKVHDNYWLDVEANTENILNETAQFLVKTANEIYGAEAISEAMVEINLE